MKKCVGCGEAVDMAGRSCPYCGGTDIIFTPDHEGDQNGLYESERQCPACGVRLTGTGLVLECPFCGRAVYLSNDGEMKNDEY